MGDMSTSGSSSDSSISVLAAEPEEEDMKYQSLRDMSQEFLPQNPPLGSQSCCSTEAEEEEATIHYRESTDASEEEEAVNNDEEENLCALELEQEAAIRKSCEEEILKYLQETEGHEIMDPPAEPAVERKQAANSTPKQPQTVQHQVQQQQLAISEALPDLPLEIGDHVYQWRSFAGCPGVFQHHGIVVNVGRDELGDMELEIADFSCILRTPPKSRSCTRTAKDAALQQSQSIDMITGREGDTSALQGILRVYKSSSSDQKWHKVHYKASVWKTSLWRSGTCTCVESDPPAKVLARAYFLLEHPEVLPSYHIFQSNCECVSVFCKTGSWSTLQASSLLSLTAAGQLKSTATLAAYVASQQVTVQSPAAGIWGYLGYTTSTQVSLLSTQPHLIPLLAAYGVVTAGGPTFVLWRCQRFWEKTAERLNEEFWKHALKDPDIFAHSMMHWSEKHKAFQGS